MTSLSLGKIGENLAISYLKKHGYKILERNFHKRWGEIDIIALDKETLVFIEVKTRKTKEFGEPIEAITPFKLKSLIKSAQYYKIHHPELPEGLRIDFLGIKIDNYGRPTKFNLVKDISS